jgi:signal transduction histidine kinase
MKYSPNGEPIEFSLICAEDTASFRIRDRGIGIPEKERAEIFKAFHRSSNVGTISGTGLGLAIVKKCVDRHNGQIFLESEVGVGTTFTIVLPLSQGTLPEILTENHSTSPIQTHETILNS